MPGKLSALSSLWLASLAAVLLAGCHAPPRTPGRPISAPAPAVARHTGRAYDIIASDSLLTVRVYRGGALALAGHNHLIACHALSGTIYVPENLPATSFELHIPVESFTVDEAPLRAKEGADFSAEVPDSAREGTKHNMLGPALLDAQHYPQIVLTGEQLVSLEGGHAVAHTRVSIRGQEHLIDVPVRFRRDSAQQVLVEGELAINQTDLGLTPFSAMLGALEVLDEMKIRFALTAHSAP
jgi:polyisoprenoid-binding protein YceI